MKSDAELIRFKRDKQVSVWIRYPLSQLLDELCMALETASAGTVRRKELVAVLISDAERDPRALANLVVRYREAPAWDETFRRDRPGPRSI